MVYRPIFNIRLTDYGLRVSVLHPSAHKSNALFATLQAPPRCRSLLPACHQTQNVKGKPLQQGEKAVARQQVRDLFQQRRGSQSLTRFLFRLCWGRQPALPCPCFLLLASAGFPLAVLRLGGRHPRTASGLSPHPFGMPLVRQSFVLPPCKPCPDAVPSSLRGSSRTSVRMASHQPPTAGTARHYFMVPG